MPDRTELNVIIGTDDPILVTGSAGFLGGRVVAGLFDRGFSNVRCLARPSSDVRTLEKFKSSTAACSKSFEATCCQPLTATRLSEMSL